MLRNTILGAARAEWEVGIAMGEHMAPRRSSPDPGALPSSRMARDTLCVCTMTGQNHSRREGC
jgi:hypothetical protein